MPNSQLIDQAIQFHRAGRLADADRLYLSALELSPANVDVLHMAGYCKMQLGELDGAIRILASAAALSPSNADLLNTLGDAYRSVGQLEQALQTFDRAVAVDEKHCAAHNNRGLTLRGLGRHEEALCSFDRAIALNPSYAIGYCNRGAVLRDLTRPLDAVASLRKALAINPKLVDAHVYLGNALADQDRFEEALAAYRTAIALAPGKGAAYKALSTLCIRLNMLEEACVALEKLADIEPQNSECLTDLGTVRRNLYRTDDALAAFDRALAIAPDSPLVNNNRAIVLLDQNRLQPAMAALERTIELAPDFADAHWNMGLVNLLAGNLATGWEKFEWRKKQQNSLLAHRRYAQPEWLGNFDIRGKRLLVYWEQGLGDTLQFCRYAKPLSETGAKVFLLVQAPLKKLLASLPYPVEIIAEGEALPEFDAHCAMMSLPHAFRTELPTIPTETPYLFADSSLQARWSDRLGEPKKFRVGLVWSGDPRKHQQSANRVDRVRSMSFATLSPLLDLPGIEFVSLQKGEEAVSQLRSHPRRQAVIDWTDELHDFVDTAALMANLDLVIAVDTSIVHLAGALDKPVWVLNRFNTCWRWLLDRADSPWYPSARIFRQSSLGRWDDVLQSVKRELASLASSYSAL